MRIELTDREALLLEELLEIAHREKLHELHHTATASYKRLLREQLEVVEALRTRFVHVPVVTR